MLYCDCLSITHKNLQSGVKLGVVHHEILHSSSQNKTSYVMYCAPMNHRGGNWRQTKIHFNLSHCPVYSGMKDVSPGRARPRHTWVNKVSLDNTDKIRSCGLTGLRAVSVHWSAEWAELERTSWSKPSDSIVQLNGSHVQLAASFSICHRFTANKALLHSTVHCTARTWMYGVSY